MPPDTKTCRLAVAGASSLRGRELMQMLEDGRFASSDIRLVDEEVAAGTLTEVAGEPVIIQSAGEESFTGAQFVFFTGSPAFALQHSDAAVRAGAQVIDLSGGLAGIPTARLWIPSLDTLLPPPKSAGASDRSLFISPATPSIIVCTVSAALAPLKVERLAFVFFQPVSESGQPGVDELENQTAKLLSLQPFGQGIFDAQVAFNLSGRYGAASSEKLSVARERIAREVHAYLHGRADVPAIQLIHAPVFYSYSFSAYAELAGSQDASAVAQVLQKAGVRMAGSDGPSVSNLSIAGETHISMNLPGRDASRPEGFWLWGAADNFRLAAANAVRIAENLA